MTKCLVCEKDAMWERNTQFSGDHPYCGECAIKEEDFLEGNSYMFWSEIDND